MWSLNPLEIIFDPIYSLRWINLNAFMINLKISALFCQKWENLTHCGKNNMGFTCDSDINFFSQLPRARCNFAGIIGAFGFVNIENCCYFIIRFEKIFRHSTSWNSQNDSKTVDLLLLGMFGNFSTAVKKETNWTELTRSALILNLYLLILQYRQNCLEKPEFAFILLFSSRLVTLCQKKTNWAEKLSSNVSWNFPSKNKRATCSSRNFPSKILKNELTDLPEANDTKSFIM